MQKSKKQIFLLFSCDEWKGTESMQLVSVCLSETMLKRAIIREIRDGNMMYNPLTSLDCTREEMIQEFKDDWAFRSRQEINGKLVGGFYDYTYNGEQYQ